MNRAFLLAGIAVVAGCGGGVETGGRASSADSLPARPDSLVLTTPAGRKVFLVAGRDDTSATGQACHEFLIALESDSGRRIVPLLYTRTAPELIDDSTLRAPLHRHCEPVAWYRIPLGTGLPEREP